MIATANLTDTEIEAAADGTEASRLATAWWAWHDADQSRHSTMPEAVARCGAWVRGESDDGPIPAAVVIEARKRVEELRQMRLDTPGARYLDEHEAQHLRAIYERDLAGQE